MTHRPTDQPKFTYIGETGKIQEYEMEAQPSVTKIFTLEILKGLHLDGLDVTIENNRVRLNFTKVFAQSRDPYRNRHNQPKNISVYQDTICDLLLELYSLFNPSFIGIVEEGYHVRAYTQHEGMVDNYHFRNECKVLAMQKLYRVGVLYEFILAYCPDFFPEELRNKMEERRNDPGLRPSGYGFSETFSLGYHKVERKYVEHQYIKKVTEIDWHTSNFALSPLVDWFKTNKDALAKQYGIRIVDIASTAGAGEAARVAKMAIKELLGWK